MKKCFFVCLLDISLTVFAAPFQNLDFESANTNNLVNIGDGILFGPTAELLPGWIGVSSTLAFDVAIDIGSAVLLSSANPFHYPVEGKYAFGIKPTFNFELGHHNQFSMLEIGEVPPDAKSIRFFNFGEPWELRIEGDLIPLDYYYDLHFVTPIQRRADVFGDISAYAGQTVELRFTTTDGPFQAFQLSGLNGLDSIRFSPEPIPEPRTWLLLGLGAGALWATRKK